MRRPSGRSTTLGRNQPSAGEHQSVDLVAEITDAVPQELEVIVQRRHVIRALEQELACVRHETQEGCRIFGGHAVVGDGVSHEQRLIEAREPRANSG